MASEHSFDISAQIDPGELKNANSQANKELESRYDLKGIKCQIELNEKDNSYKLTSSSSSKLDVLKDILISKLIKREINPKAISELSREDGAVSKLILKINSSIDKVNAKKITKAIKDSKLKVNTSIKGEELRVSAKQIDELQAVISLVKSLDLELTLSFKNLK